MKTRDELLREFYCGEVDRLQPRPQTGPKASFMSWVGQLEDREASERRTEKAQGEEDEQT